MKQEEDKQRPIKTVHQGNKLIDKTLYWDTHTHMDLIYPTKDLVRRKTPVAYGL